MAAEDSSKRDRFARKMTAILNAGALNLGIAIGYRTGLFDALQALPEAGDADAMAAAAGLNRRYVEEWLGVMATGGIVELIPTPAGAPHYRLPPEHAAFLCRRADSVNLAVYTQEIPLLTRLALEPVIASFASGAGVPYRCYPEFQGFMNELAAAKHESLLVQRFLPSVNGGRLLERLRRGIRVCDLGRGQGVATRLMAEAFPESRFRGFDLDPEAIAEAAAAAHHRHLTNLSFEVRDAAHLSADPNLKGGFDFVTAFDAIHDQSRPLEALRGVLHLLAADGLFSMIDIAAESAHQDNLNHSMGPFLYTVSLLHCLPVGLNDGGAGLGMMWGRERALDLLAEAGFSRVEIVEMDFDPFNRHFQCRP